MWTRSSQTKNKSNGRKKWREWNEAEYDDRANLNWWNILKSEMCIMKKKPYARHSSQSYFFSRSAFLFCPFRLVEWTVWPALQLKTLTEIEFKSDKWKTTITSESDCEQIVSSSRSDLLLLLATHSAPNQRKLVFRVRFFFCALFASISNACDEKLYTTKKCCGFFLLISPNSPNVIFH